MIFWLSKLYFQFWIISLDLSYSTSGGSFSSGHGGSGYRVDASTYISTVVFDPGSGQTEQILQDNIDIYPDYHLKFSLKMTKIGNFREKRIFLSFELDTVKDITSITDPENHLRQLIPSFYPSIFIPARYDLIDRQNNPNKIFPGIGYKFQYHDQESKQKTSYVVPGYQFNKTNYNTLTDDKWCSFEIIHYKSNIFIWINGKEYSAENMKLNTDTNDFSPKPLPSLKKPEIGKIKLHYFDDTKYQIKDLSYKPYPNEDSGQSIFNLSFHKLNSKKVKLQTFSNIGKLDVKLVRQTEDYCRHNLRKKRSPFWWWWSGNDSSEESDDNSSYEQDSDKSDQSVITVEISQPVQTQDISIEHYGLNLIAASFTGNLTSTTKIFDNLEPGTIIGHIIFFFHFFALFLFH